MSARNRRSEYIDPRTTRLCEKHCPWFVRCLDDWTTCSCKENAAYSVHRVHGRYQPSQVSNDQRDPDI